MIARILKAQLMNLVMKQSFSVAVPIDAIIFNLYLLGTGKISEAISKCEISKFYVGHFEWKWHQPMV